MKLTPKQELFISEYKMSDEEISAQWVIKGLIAIYLQSEKHSDKKYSAWLIKRLKPTIKIIGLEKLLDIEELNKLALEKQDDIEKILEFAQERQRQKRKDFSLTDEEWLEAIEYFESSCAYCGDSEGKLTYDHFIPFSKGGNFTKDNIIPCCIKCNSSKKNKDFKEWYRSKSFYSEGREKQIMDYFKMI